MSEHFNKVNNLLTVLVSLFVNVSICLQVIFRIPEFVRRFVEGAPDVFSTFPDDPVNDFNVQT